MAMTKSPNCSTVEIINDDYFHTYITNLIEATGYVNIQDYKGNDIVSNHLFLISPYIKLWKKLKRSLKSAVSRQVNIHIFLRKDKIEDYEDSISELLDYNINVYAIDNLHVKLYFANHNVIFGSKNLHEFSALNSVDLTLSSNNKKFIKDIWNYWHNICSDNEVYKISKSDNPSVYSKSSLVQTQLDYDKIYELFYSTGGPYEFVGLSEQTEEKEIIDIGLKESIEEENIKQIKEIFLLDRVYLSDEEFENKYPNFKKDEQDLNDEEWKEFEDMKENDKFKLSEKDYNDKYFINKKPNGNEQIPKKSDDDDLPF